MNKKRKKIFKIILWSILIILFLALFSLLFANFRINHATKDLVFDNIELVPENKVGILLGTSKYLRSGDLNQYFEYRISAAEQLFKSGKIKYIVISGDNSRKNYNEPQDMKNELVKRGIPQENIYLDYAGFRTYDSMIRMREIFGQNSFTVISQEFHNQRAVFIANTLNMNTVGYNAKDVTAYYGFKTKLREKFARVKVFLDLGLNKKTKFLGEQIEIE